MYELLEVIVLAAGKGTRMYSDQPKVLHRVCGETLLARTILAVSVLKPQRIVVVVGYAGELVKNEVERCATYSTDAVVSCVVQGEQLGTGHAAHVGMSSAAAGAGKVLIVPGDIPLLNGALLQEFVQSQTVQTVSVAVLTCIHPSPAGFGRIVRTTDDSVAKIVEEKDCTDAERQISEVNTSVYLCEKSFLRNALARLKPENVQGELYLTDIVSDAVRQGQTVAAHVTDDVARVSGANNRYELSMLEKFQRLAINRRHMEQGVTFEDPDSTYIDEGVVIGHDTFIGAGTRLRGNTRIASRVTVEGNSLLEDAEIGAGSLIKLSCYLKQCTVGADCEIGPFAQLRPETVLHEGVKIGNFVEVKKAELHPGAKANHLSYIGDAEIGPGSNIGAGTIFCNYDGVNKHRTTLEEGVFVGSNSVLVAPLKLGKQCYVGAGSAIIADVPAGALAVARSKQTNVDGWVERKHNQKKI